MTELIDFFNRNNDSKYDLLKIALTHHRFAWVHPFQNGNGRVARLLTYAMLIERGFNVETGRILNPSAVFCNDRETYYKMLFEADSGTDKGLLKWCKYVLTGLRDELTKIDKLLNYDFLSQRILKPAIRYTLERKLVTDLEASILNLAVDKTIFRSADLVDILPNIYKIKGPLLIHVLTKKGKGLHWAEKDPDKVPEMPWLDARRRLPSP